MKIGIAATTFARGKHIEFWTKQVAKHSPEDAVFHIANDNVERKGVSFRKTECIRELYNEGADYFFIMDDDCFPVKDGWVEFFTDALERSGNNHLIYTHESPSNKLISVVDGIGNYENSHGCLMVFTRKAIEKVGGFNPNYHTYGFEHSCMSNRIHHAGLNPLGKYLCPIGAEEFIYSCDLDFTRPEIQKQLKHKSSMHPREALHHAQKAYEVYQKPTQIYFPL